MTETEIAAPIILYGAPQSLYSGRARSYLIKSGLDYEEHLIAQRRYHDVVLPKAGGRRSMPTVELPDGTVIRDSVAIVDHFEAERGLAGNTDNDAPEDRRCLRAQNANTYSHPLMLYFEQNQ